LFKIFHTVTDNYIGNNAGAAECEENKREFEAGTDMKYYEEVSNIMNVFDQKLKILNTEKSSQTSIQTNRLSLDKKGDNDSSVTRSS
jgi:hypothetical protein